VDKSPFDLAAAGLSGTGYRLIGNVRVVFQEQRIGLSGTDTFRKPLILFPKSLQREALTL
jgi:hypothetical protein